MIKFARGAPRSPLFAHLPTATTTTMTMIHHHLHLRTPRQCRRKSTRFCIGIMVHNATNIDIDGLCTGIPIQLAFLHQKELKSPSDALYDAPLTYISWMVDHIQQWYGLRIRYSANTRANSNTSGPPTRNYCIISPHIMPDDIPNT